VDVAVHGALRWERCSQSGVVPPQSKALTRFAGVVQICQQDAGGTFPQNFLDAKQNESNDDR